MASRPSRRKPRQRAALAKRRVTPTPPPPVTGVIGGRQVRGAATPSPKKAPAGLTSRGASIIGRSLSKPQTPVRGKGRSVAAQAAAGAKRKAARPTKKADTAQQQLRQRLIKTTGQKPKGRPPAPKRKAPSRKIAGFLAGGTPVFAGGAEKKAQRKATTPRRKVSAGITFGASRGAERKAAKARLLAAARKRSAARKKTKRPTRRRR